MLGAKVFNRSLAEDFFGAQKTFGMQQASQPWLLMIDADERVSSKTAGFYSSSAVVFEAEAGIHDPERKSFYIRICCAWMFASGLGSKIFAERWASSIGKVHESIGCSQKPNYLGGSFISHTETVTFLETLF